MGKWFTGGPRTCCKEELVNWTFPGSSLTRSKYLFYDSTFGHLPLSSFIFLSLALAVVFQFCDQLQLTIQGRLTDRLSYRKAIYGCFNLGCIQQLRQCFDSERFWLVWRINHPVIKTINQFLQYSSLKYSTGFAFVLQSSKTRLETVSVYVSSSIQHTLALVHVVMYQRSKSELASFPGSPASECKH